MASGGSRLSKRSWIIAAVIVATLWVLAGVAAYASIRRTSSMPDVVASFKPLPGANGGCMYAAWSPDGQKILYESGGLFIADADGTNHVYLGEGDYPAWSPDGTSIVFATDDGLLLINADGSKRRLLLDIDGVPLPLSKNRRIESIAWSPDGDMIAFEAWGFVPDPSDESQHTGTSIDGTWIVNADGSGLRQLGEGSQAVRSPVWSPDGQRIAFISHSGEGRTDIWTCRFDGTDPRQLTTSDECEFDMSWSPDGSKIAFASGYSPDEEERPEIWVMDGDGGNKVQLTDGPESYEKPAWSPDGSMIAFSSTRLGPLGDIWIMNADGSGKTRLTRTSRSSFTCSSKEICYKEPRWSPDGTKIIFPNVLTQWEGWGSSWSGYDRLWVLELDVKKGLG